VERVNNVLSAYRSAVELGAIAPLAWLLEQRARADRGDDFDADLGKDVSVTDESMAAVRAMTIHKAKGLQGKYVIVYGWQTTLDKRTPERPRRKEPLCLTDHSGKVVRGYQLDWGPLTIISPLYPRAYALNQELEAEEAKRLAYVAATRATDRLVLLSPNMEEVTDGLLAEVKPAIDAGAWSATAVNATLNVLLADSRKGESHHRDSSLGIANPDVYRKTWQQRTAALGQQPLALLHRPSKAERDEEEDEVEVADYIRRSIREAREISRQAGTLVHSYLERHLTDAEFDEARLGPLIGDDVSESGSEKAKAALREFFRSPNHRRAAAATILGREMPVYLTAFDKAWGGVIDLVIEENGAIIGVDYKVMEKPPVLSVEHEQQQRIYSEALVRPFPGRTVHFEFWWLA
jgi:ATP-dependent exoDNAse (exonuclease V) beta subunit